MIRLLIFILFVSGIAISFVPNDAFGCSVSRSPLEIFSLYNNYYSNTCEKIIGHLSWLGLMLVMLIVCAEIVIIKKWLKFPRKFYLMIIPAILFCMLGYSIAFYETFDLTEFFLPHDKFGNFSDAHYISQLAIHDFTNMLEKHDVKYRSENMNIMFDTYKLSRQQYLNHDYPFPYEYCGIVIADDHTEYWYSASYNDKKITESKFHDDFPQKPCGSNSQTCFCKVTKWEREQFKFRP